MRLGQLDPDGKDYYSEEGATLLLMESFYNKVTAQMVADKSGAKLLTLDTDVLARPELKTWFEVTHALLVQLAQ